jgi:hypothetical protein
MGANTNNNTAALINLSTLSQYFIPFGNFIFPVMIWSSLKDKSEYIDKQGKQTINFQLSLFLYSIVLCMIAVPILIATVFKNINLSAIANGKDLVLENFSFENISGMVTIAILAIVVFIFMKVAEFFLIIYAAVKTSNGEDFKYPLTIPFIK